MTRRIAIVGAGWAGLSAAVRAIERGWQVELLEAARAPGGRARSLSVPGCDTPLDNGQHILIGAYTETLSLMERVGLSPRQLLERLPLTLRFPDGRGLAVQPSRARPSSPWPLLRAMVSVRGWSGAERGSLLMHALRWQWRGFSAPPEQTVAELCQAMPTRVVRDLIEPLCLSALNTPMEQASAAVLLRVLHDAMTGPGWQDWAPSDLLIPRTDLGSLMPQPAIDWVRRRGGTVRLGHRVDALRRSGNGWQVLTRGQGIDCDRVVLACGPAIATRLLKPLAASESPDSAYRDWIAQAEALPYEAIGTVYVHAADWRGWSGDLPMLALDSGPNAPAQFVFDRGRLGGAPQTLAFVVSACTMDREGLGPAVQRQAQQALQIAAPRLMQTVIEKRATFACRPGLQRPRQAIAPGLWAAGDAIEGPYPATLEGAVRSGRQAVEAATIG